MYAQLVTLLNAILCTLRSPIPAHTVFASLAMDFQLYPLLKIYLVLSTRPAIHLGTAVD